jgi:tRNA threonylcarbamoyladenosine biosynthesis protein TsaB
MYILAIETTGKYGTAAVINDDGCVCSSCSSEEMNHLKDIISISDESLRKAGIGKKDLTHIAASIGPGSFTGIRIGVTTARTMAQMMGIPCIAISSLAAMADRVMTDAVRTGSGLIVPLINARRHQVYAGTWEITITDDWNSYASVHNEEPEWLVMEPLDEDRQYMIEELLSVIMERIKRNEDIRPVYFTGDGIDAYGEIIASVMPAGSYVLAPEEIRYQHADSVANLALVKAISGEVCSYNDLMPDYMRLSEAEQRLRAGTLSDKIRRTVV